jgi:hypothetical protein
MKAKPSETIVFALIKSNEIKKFNFQIKLSNNSSDNSCILDYKLNYTVFKYVKMYVVLHDDKNFTLC